MAKRREAHQHNPRKRDPLSRKKGANNSLHFHKVTQYKENQDRKKPKAPLFLLQTIVFFFYESVASGVTKMGIKLLRIRSTPSKRCRPNDVCTGYHQPGSSKTNEDQRLDGYSLTGDNNDRVRCNTTCTFWRIDTERQSESNKIVVGTLVARTLHGNF